MIEFGGVGVANEEVVDSESEGVGVSVVAEEHRGRGFRVAVLGRSWDKSPDWGRPGTVLRTSQKIKGLLWACRRKGKRPSLVRVGREIEDTSILTDSGEGRMAPR